MDTPDPLHTIACDMIDAMGPQWDAPAAYYMIRTRPNALGMPTPYAEALPQTHAVNALPPHLVLEQLVRSFAEHVLDTGKPLEDMGYLGVGMAIEAWMAAEGQTEELARRAAAGGSVPSLADLPGSRELRLAHIVTRDGRIIIRRLVRGEDRPAPFAPHDLSAELGGRVADTVRNVAQGIADLHRPDATMAAARILYRLTPMATPPDAHARFLRTVLDTTDGKDRP